MGLLREFPGRAAAVDISGGNWILADNEDAIESSGYCMLFIGTGGDVVVDGAETGTQITFKNVPSGTELKLRVKTVYQTGTTASNIVAIYE